MASSVPVDRKEATTLLAPPRPPPAPLTWGGLAGRLLVAGAGALAVAFVGLPVAALVGRVPLAALLATLQTPVVIEALRLTALSSAASLGLMVLAGTPVAYALGRGRWPGRRLVETLLELPLVLPPAVAGLALLLAFGRRTPIGQFLESIHIEVAFTVVAVVLAQTFVAAPFYIKAARTAFAGVPRELLEAAAVGGASGWQTFRYVIAPLALPGLTTGAILGWARAVGEFGATILFAGNTIGRTQTMPLAIYLALESDLNAALVLAVILVATSFTVLFVTKLLGGSRFEVVSE